MLYENIMYGIKKKFWFEILKYIYTKTKSHLCSGSEFSERMKTTFSKNILNLQKPRQSRTQKQK